MRILLTLAVLALVGLLNFALWTLPNRPHELAPLAGGKLQSVSFAPFRDGQSPLTQVYPTPDQIDEDLRAIREQVVGVRTYTSREGLEHVAPLAAKYGLKVLQGAWLGARLPLNDQEVDSLIALANAHPDTITRVVVGNEVLLRRDLTPDQLVGYIRKVKAAIKQPVTYADVWEWWLKYPQLADEVDFITIHLLPYWEDVPAGVDDAAQHVLWSYRQIQERFPGKPILVGEVGWPTAGRQRGPAAPGLVEKARFINSFVALAAEQGFDYNIIEAFDQSWKIRLEGTVGGHWGLYGTDRAPKFSLSGPVVENPNWPLHFALSSALALLALIVISRWGPPMPLSRFAATALFAQGLASAYVHAGVIAVTWNYYWYDLLQAALLMTLQAMVAVAILRVVVGEPRLGRWGERAALAMTAYGIAWNLLLVFDGRYRDFPIPDYLIPCLGLFALTLYRPPARWVGPRAAGLAAVLLVLGAVGIAAGEALGRIGGETWVWLGFTNHQALAWAGMQLLLAVPFARQALALGTRGLRPLAGGVGS